MNWINENLVPIWNDNAWTIIGGGATIGSDKITLPINSSVRLRLDSGIITLPSNYIRFIIKFNGDIDEYWEYIPKSALDINIEYGDNTIQSSKMILTKDKFDGEYYISDNVLQVESKVISKMDIYLNNYDNATDTLYIKSLEMYKSEEIKEEQVARAVKQTVALKKLTSYANGCIVEWKGDIEDLKLEFVTDENDEFIGILVNDTDFIQYQVVSGLLPSD